MKKFVKIRGLDQIEGACWNLGYGRIRKHKRLEIVEFHDIKVFGVFRFVEGICLEKSVMRMQTSTTSNITSTMNTYCQIIK